MESADNVAILESRLLRAVEGLQLVKPVLERRLAACTLPLPQPPAAEPFVLASGANAWGAERARTARLLLSLTGPSPLRSPAPGWGRG